MSDVAATPPLGLLLSDDLIFTSRITGTACALQCAIKPARSVEALLTLAAAEMPAGVLVDLAFPGLAIADLVEQLKERGRPRVVAYGSHVDTATLRAARAAGCDLVLPRSKFVEDLPQALPEWLTRSQG